VCKKKKKKKKKKKELEERKINYFIRNLGVDNKGYKKKILIIDIKNIIILILKKKIRRI
jgi:hypothetical protein